MTASVFGVFFLWLFASGRARRAAEDPSAPVAMQLALGIFVLYVGRAAGAEERPHAVSSAMQLEPEIISRSCHAAGAEDPLLSIVP